MKCKKCGSENVTIMASATEKAKGRHSIIYWLLIGWWLHPLMWLVATLPMLIWRIICPNRKTKTVTHTMAVCQSCGYSWEVRP